MSPELQRRWATLGGPSASEAWRQAGDELLSRWAEPWRGYHNQQHLTESLDALDLLGAGLAERVAIWFHDAIYGLGPGADELASADLAVDTLAGLGVAASIRAEVRRLVLVTEQHSPGPGDLPGARVSDADMAILASSSERYADSVRGIRAEYSQFDDAQFNFGRIAVLEAFLAHPQLFHTQHGLTHWEQPARRNITTELAARRTS